MLIKSFGTIRLKKRNGDLKFGFPDGLVYGYTAEARVFLGLLPVSQPLFLFDSV